MLFRDEIFRIGRLLSLGLLHDYVLTLHNKKKYCIQVCVCLYLIFLNFHIKNLFMIWVLSLYLKITFIINTFKCFNINLLT